MLRCRFWVAIVPLALLSCGGPAATPAEVASRAGQSFARTQYLHFAITVEGGPAYIDPESTLSLRSMEGDLARPDRVRVTMRVGAAGLAVIELRAIGIGKEQFMTRPITGQWERMPPEWGFDPTVLFDPELGIGAALDGTEWEAQVGEERLGKERCYHLRGTAPGEILSPLTSWMIVADQARMEAWVAKADCRILQVRIEEPPKEEGGHPTIWLLVFSAFDQPVTIERPPGL